MPILTLMAAAVVGAEAELVHDKKVKAVLARLLLACQYPAAYDVRDVIEPVLDCSL